MTGELIGTYQKLNFYKEEHTWAEFCAKVKVGDIIYFDGFRKFNEYNIYNVTDVNKEDNEVSFFRVSRGENAWKRYKYPTFDGNECAKVYIGRPLKPLGNLEDLL